MTWPNHIDNLVSAAGSPRSEILARLLGAFTHLRPSSAAALVAPVLTDLSFVLLLGVAAISVAQVARGRTPSTLQMILACAMWLSAVAYLTLRPGDSGRLNLVPFAFGPNATPFEPVSNILLFVPFGILLRARGWRLLAVVGLGLALSLCVELSQYLLDIGRTADVNDVIENTLGTIVGWLVAVAVSHRARRPARDPLLDKQP